jgi:hypothetical protein
MWRLFFQGETQVGFSCGDSLSRKAVHQVYIEAVKASVSGMLNGEAGLLTVVYSSKRL